MREHPASHEEAFTSALERALAGVPEPLDRETLARVCNRLLRRRAEHLKMIASNSPLERRVQVVRELVRRSESYRFSDARRMMLHARAAVTVADGLPAAAAPAGKLADARAEAWACLANALRLTGDSRAAEEAWGHAETHLAAGTGDALVAAKLARLKGVLRLRQRRFGDAVELLEGAATAYEGAGELDQAGRTWITLGVAHHERGDLARAALGAFRGGQLIDRERFPELAIAALNNLVFYLHQAGHREDAEYFLTLIRELVARQGMEIETLRLRWLAAKMSAAAGRKVQARYEFDAVRRGFIDQSLPYDAALVSLELALLYAESGSGVEVERLATEMYPIFLSADLPREATASLLLFVQAVNDRTASPARIRELLTSLETQRGARE